MRARWAPVEAEADPGGDPDRSDTDAKGDGGEASAAATAAPEVDAWSVAIDRHQGGGCAGEFERGAGSG